MVGLLKPFSQKIKVREELFKFLKGSYPHVYIHFFFHQKPYYIGKNKYKIVIWHFFNLLSYQFYYKESSKNCRVWITRPKL